MARKLKTKFELEVVKKVKEIREAKGFTQDDIAVFLDFTRGFIGQIESPNSPSKYNLNHLNILSIEMGCSPKDFLPEKGVH